MKIQEFTYIMKDGREAIIRSPKEEDVQGMLDYLYVSAGETEFILREAMLVCLVDGKVAGNCQIVWTTGIKTRHRAAVAIALLKEYWNQGIGTRMFQELIRIAENNPSILQMELDFVEGNSRARALYEKMGFRITGVRPNAIRLKDGTLLNEYSMIREIRR